MDITIFCDLIQYDRIWYFHFYCEMVTAISFKLGTRTVFNDLHMLIKLFSGFDPVWLNFGSFWVKIGILTSTVNSEIYFIQT